MNKNDVFYFGYVAAKHGLKGDLLLKLDVDDTSNYKNIDSLFVEVNKNLMPLFISKINFAKQNEAIITCEDVGDVKQFVGCSVYLAIKHLPKLEGDKFYYHEIIGYKVTDKAYGEIGVLQTVLEYPHQQIFSIKHLGKEILVPVVDEFIDRVDKANKHLYLSAPEGLIDLYLGNNKEEEE